MILPIAVRQLSISPFISRSIALATSTLLYLEYLSNTEGEDRVKYVTSDKKKKQTLKILTFKHHSANLDEGEGNSGWWGSQWSWSSLCPSYPRQPHTESWHRYQLAAHRFPQSCQPVIKTNRTQPRVRLQSVSLLFTLQEKMAQIQPERLSYVVVECIHIQCFVM